MAPRGLTKKYLRAQCQALVQSVQADRLASADDLAAFAPGGARNPGTDVVAWLQWYGTLRAWRGGPRVDARESTPTTAVDREAREAEIMQALGDVPETVLLIEAPLQADGEPHYVTVHPKGWDAVAWLMCVDSRLTHWNTKRAEYEQRQDDSDLLERISAEIIWLYKLIVWGVTTPDAFLPFDPFTITDDTDLPEWLGALHPIDLARIHAAFTRVQQVRMLSLRALMTEPTDGTKPERPSWVTLYTQLEDAKHIPTNVLMRDHSIPRLMAQAAIAGDTRKRAMKEAREKQDKAA